MNKALKYAINVRLSKLTSLNRLNLQKPGRAGQSTSLDIMGGYMLD